MGQDFLGRQYHSDQRYETTSQLYWDYIIIVIKGKFLPGPYCFSGVGNVSRWSDPDISYCIFCPDFQWCIILTYTPTTIIYTLFICPGSSDPFSIVAYHIKWVTNSWTYSIYSGSRKCNLLLIQLIISKPFINPERYRW